MREDERKIDGTRQPDEGKVLCARSLQACARRINKNSR